MSGVFCVVLLSLFVYPTFVNGRDAVDASDSSKKCVVGFRSLRGKKAIDLSLATARIKPGRTLWIGCSCLNAPPDEDYYDDGYWTGPGKDDLNPRRTPDEKIWYTYKNKMAVLKLRGKVTCSAAGEYVCHLAGVTKSMMLEIAGCNATNKTVSPTEEKPEPTSDVTCLPPPPLSLAATMVTPTSFKLTWAKPLRSGDTLLYEVVVSSELFGERTIATDQLSITVRDLEEAQDYVVGVSAINAAGRGPQVRIHVKTKEAVPNGPVKNIKAYAVNSTTLMVSWEAPDDKYINAEGGITLYSVHVGLFCGDKANSFYTVKTKEVVRGLMPGMWYCLRVLPGNHLGFAPHSAVFLADIWVELPNKRTPPKVEPTSGTHDIDRDPSNINTDEDE